MIVKCPKCRFKYETPVAPGVKELSCVCSRCGFPFTYAVPEDVQNEVHQESTSHTQQPSSNVQRERYNNRPDTDNVSKTHTNPNPLTNMMREVRYKSIKSLLHIGFPQARDRDVPDSSSSYSSLRWCSWFLACAIIITRNPIRLKASLLRKCRR